MTGFAARVVKKSALIYDVRWQDSNGIYLFAILDVDKAKYQSFEQVLKQQKPYNPSDFGKILYSGMGEPSVALKNEMNKKYGMYQENE